MAQTRTRQVIMMTAFMIVITGLLLFIMLSAYGVPAAMSVAITAAMATLTAILASISYGYREMQQRRAFTGKKRQTDSTEAQHQTIVEIDLPMETAFDLAMDGLLTFHDQPMPLPENAVTRKVPRKQILKIHENNREMGSIRAGLRAKLVGVTDPYDFSQITIQLQRVDKHTTRIQINSEAVNLIDAYDMGKNLHYVNQLALYLRRESDTMNAAARLTQADTDLQESANDTDEGNQASKRFS